MAVTLERPMPASPEVERSILGSILLDNKAFKETEQLDEDDFSFDSHRRIYSCMVDLAKSARPIDPVLLAEELDRRKELEAIGGVCYISSLLDGVPDRPSIAQYVHIVTEKALRRRVILTSQKTIERTLESIELVEQILTDSETVMRRLAEGRPRGAGLAHIRTWDQIPTLDRLPAEDVNWVVEAMVPAGSVVLWAGESGSYKTWLSLWLSKAVQEGREFLGRRTVQLPILYLDRENPLPLIQERCSILGIHSSETFRIWGGWQPDPPPMIGDHRLLEIARKMKPLIVVDFFIRFHGADENSATEMGRVMGEVRALANAGAVVILQHHKPKAEGTQYRGSSDIKAGVDVAFAVTHEKEQEALTIQCFKNRFGEESKITVRPKIDSGKLFEVTEDQTLKRGHEEEQMLCKIIESQPGLNQGEIVEKSGMPVHKARSILKRGEGSLWRTELGPRGRRDYHPLTSDSSFSAFPPYSPEKLKSSSVALSGELRVLWRLSGPSVRQAVSWWSRVTVFTIRSRSKLPRCCTNCDVTSPMSCPCCGGSPFSICGLSSANESGVQADLESCLWLKISSLLASTMAPRCAGMTLRW
jgi:DnaB-like helicase N terminal domain/AAA domain